MSEPRAIEAAPVIGHIVVSCQCRRWPMTSGCKERMTQEDLLCDECRAGKCGQLTIDGDGQPPCHMRFVGFSLERHPEINRLIEENRRA